MIKAGTVTEERGAQNVGRVKERMAAQKVNNEKPYSDRHGAGNARLNALAVAIGNGSRWNKDSGTRGVRGKIHGSSSSAGERPWLLHNGFLSLVRYRRHASTRIKYRQIVSEVAPSTLRSIASRRCFVI